jgi:hypothetical protein
VPQVACPLGGNAILVVNSSKDFETESHPLGEYPLFNKSPLLGGGPTTVWGEEGQHGKVERVLGII